MLYVLNTTFHLEPHIHEEWTRYFKNEIIGKNQQLVRELLFELALQEDPNGITVSYQVWLRTLEDLASFEENEMNQNIALLHKAFPGCFVFFSTQLKLHED